MTGLKRVPTDQGKSSPLPPSDPQRHGAAANFSWVDLQRRGRASKWWRLSPWAFGLLALVAVVLVVLHIGTIERFTRLARAARPEWLLLACIAQGATYVCAALVWQQALLRAGHPRQLGNLVPLGIAKLFTDQVVPSSGVSGAILVAGGLARRQVPTNVAMAALLVELVSYFGAFLVAVITSFGILWLHDQANGALLSVVAIFAAIVIAIPSGVLWMKQWGRRLPVVLVQKLPGTALVLRAIAEAPTELLGDPVLLVETVILELAIFALDALTLWLAFRALGDNPAIWVAFVSFIMASLAATLGPIPLGLGTFEAACVGMLSLLGVTIETALAATLLLRGLTFWLPMIPGLWLARREIAPQ